MMTEAEKEVGEMLGEIREELARARAKFPGRNLTIVALIEEVGELANAAMDKPREHVYREAVQVAVMAMRVWLDGDHSVEYRRAQNGLKPLRSVTLPRPTIEELEAILNDPNPPNVTINPDGTVTVVGASAA